MNRKLRELLDQINEKKTEVENLATADKVDEATAAKEELKALQAKFDVLKDVVDNEEEEKMNSVTNAVPEIAPAPEKVDALKAFANDIRTRFRNVANETTATDGGYTVPVDVQTQVNQYKQTLVSLEPLISVENVATESGARTFQKKGLPTAFKTVAEKAAIGEGDDMEFERIEYAVEKRAAYWGITEELLADSDADIVGLLAQWIAKGDVVTTNEKVLAILAAKAATAVTNLDGLKEAINVKLGQTYKQNATVIVNDTGLNYLDTLKDTTGRYLLTPDISNPGSLRLSAGAISLPIFVVPDAQLANPEGGTTTTIYVGDFKEAVRKFNRQGYTIKSSDVATANGISAFENDLVYYKVTERNDFKQIDGDAFVHLTLTM